MTKRIVFKNPDGSCGIIIPAENTGLTIEEIAAKDVPSGLEHRITDTSNILSDRTFREAWTDDNPTDTVDVDMPRARVIHMDRIRDLRDIKLEELDKETLKGNDVQAAKQVLRDLPSTLDLSVATTPEELVALTPSEVL